MSNGKDYKNVSFQCPVWYKEKIEAQAAKEMISKSDLIRKAMNQYFQKVDKE